VFGPVRRPLDGSLNDLLPGVQIGEERLECVMEADMQRGRVIAQRIVQVKQDELRTRLKPEITAAWNKVAISRLRHHKRINPTSLTITRLRLPLILPPRARSPNVTLQ
jgi:hypothetical protein